MKKLLLTALMLAVLAATGCAKQPEPIVEAIPSPIVTIEMADGNTIEMELYPDIAPNTVSNFVTLIQSGFYDGLGFHRVIGGFMIQGGDPNDNGTGGPGYSIRGEFSNNGFEGNTLSHTRGVVSMARSSNMDSAGSQFFIMHGDYAKLDGDYAAFGKLIGDESYNTLDMIANTGTDAGNYPLIEYKIKRMTVDTKGYQYSVVKIEDE